MNTTTRTYRPIQPGDPVAFVYYDRTDTDDVESTTFAGTIERVWTRGSSFQLRGIDGRFEQAAVLTWFTPSGDARASTP